MQSTCREEHSSGRPVAALLASRICTSRWWREASVRYFFIIAEKARAWGQEGGEKLCCERQSSMPKSEVLAYYVACRSLLTCDAVFPESSRAAWTKVKEFRWPPTN
jgi:hypothetical protein